MGIKIVLLSVHIEILCRREAYTCWPQNTGAEVFNFGTRIDHILFAGSCLHEVDDLQCHNFISCHVKECDILTQYKRCKPGSTLRYRTQLCFNSLTLMNKLIGFVFYHGRMTYICHLKYFVMLVTT